VSTASADARDAATGIIAAGRRLGARGLISASEGNLSIRLDADTIAITPSGRRKDELTEDDIVIAGLDGREREARSASGLEPSSDLTIHLALYAAREDIRAVAHAHMPAALALTLGGEVPDPVALPETAHFIPRLPFVPFAEMGSVALATRIVDALTGQAPPPDVALLERHGAVSVGTDLTAAIDRLELVEVLCRTWRDSLLVRAARITLDRSRGRSSGTGPTG
jgi:L-fuculose-phosphate aldolase